MFKFFKKSERDGHLIPPINSEIQMPESKPPREETLFEKYDFPLMYGYHPLNGPDAVDNANKRFERLLTIIDDLQKQIDELKVKNQ